MKALSTLALSLIGLALLLLSPVQAAPPAFQANYSVERSGIKLGDMNIVLTHNGQTYNYQKTITANGLAALISGDTVNERSSGLIQGGQLRPQNFLYHHKSKRRDRRDQFTMANGVVKGSYDNKAYQLNVPPQTLDSSAAELQLMVDIAANRPLQYQVTERGELKIYRFQRLGREQVSVPAGTFNAEKIRLLREGNERETILWLAPELNYAPVQLSHNERGELVLSRLTRYQLR